MKKNKNTVIAVIVAVLVLAGIGFYLWKKKKNTDTNTAIPPIIDGGTDSATSKNTAEPEPTEVAQIVGRPKVAEKLELVNLVAQVTEPSTPQAPPTDLEVSKLLASQTFSTSSVQRIGRNAGLFQTDWTAVYHDSVFSVAPPFSDYKNSPVGTEIMFAGHTFKVVVEKNGTKSLNRKLNSGYANYQPVI